MLTVQVAKAHLSDSLVLVEARAGQELEVCFALSGSLTKTGQRKPVAVHSFR